jgi:hypothetical protein
MKPAKFRIIFLFFGCILTLSVTNIYAQKLLDPSGSISVVTSSSGGSNTSIAVAYSIRQLKTTYDHPASITPPASVAGFTNSTTPLLRVRRDTDDGQLDLGYDVNGNLDSITLKNFVTNNGVNPSANGRVTVWYDQSGNSRDAYPPTVTNQFFIVSSGVIQRSSGGQIGVAGINGGMMEYRPSAGTTFNGATGANIYGIDGDRTMNVVSQPRSYANGGASDGAGTYLIDRYGDPSTANGGTPSGIDQPLTCLKAIGSNWALQLRLQDGSGLGNSFAGSVAISTGRSDNVMAIRSGNIYYLYVNGVLAGNTTLAGYNPMSPVRIGYGSSTGENVYYGEFILFPTALFGADLTTLNVSQGDYFSLGTAPNVWSGSISNNWATAGNWSLATLPDALASVTIPNGTPNSPTISSSVTVKSITISPGATLTVNSTLSLSNNLTVNGTLAGTGTVVMNGGVEQTISGNTTPIVFSNLTISNTVNNVVTSNSINVSGTLTVNAGGVFAPVASAVVNSTGAAGTITGSGTVMVTRIASTANYQSQYKFSTNTLTNLTVNYGGAGAQTITIGGAGVNYGHLTVSGSDVKTLTAAVSATNVTGNINVLGATLDNGGFAIVGNGSRTFSVSDGAKFKLSGTTSTYPTVFGTFIYGTNSTVEYAGSGAQTIAAANYGNLTSSDVGARTLASSSTIGIAGTFTKGTNSYTVTGSTVNYNGTGAQTVIAFNYQNLTVSGARGGANIALGTGVVGIAGTASFSATGVGGWSVIGNTVNYNGTSAQVVATNFQYNNLTYSIGSSNRTGSPTVNGVFSFELTGTPTTVDAITYGPDATVQFNRTASYTLPNNNIWPATFIGTGGVIIKNTGTITLNAVKAIANTLYIETGGSLNLNALTTNTSTYLTLGGVLQTGNGSYGGTGSGANNLNATFFSAGAGLISINVKTWTGNSGTNWNTAGNWNPSGVPLISDNVVIPAAPSNQPAISTAATCLNLLMSTSSALTVSSNTLTIAGNFVNEGGTITGVGTIAFSGTNKVISGTSTNFQNLTINNNASISLNGNHSCTSFAFGVGDNNTSFTHNADASLTISGTVTIVQSGANSITKSWNINGGTATVGGLISYSGTNTTTSRIQEIVITTGTLNANGGITFAAANNTGRRIVMSGGAGRINLQGTLTLGGQQTLTAGTASSTFNYTGSTAQTIPFFSSGGYNNIEINNTAGATLTAAVTTGNVTGNILVSTGALSNGGFAITGNGSAAFTVMNGAMLTLAGTSAFPTGFGTITLQTNSTVNYNSTGAQTVAARSYANLTLSGARTTNSITCAAGVISIAGIFTPSATFSSGNYITTGNTVEFNSTSVQTISAFNYSNLTSSSTGGRILSGSGTIGIAGAFTPGLNSYSVTGSTVNYNGTGAQTVAPINYNNLTLSGTRTTNNITLASGETVAVSGTLTLSASFTSGNYVVTNNTVSFNGSISQTIPAFNFNNLTSSSTGARVLVSGGTIGVAGDFITGTNTYTITGNTINFNGTISQNIPVFTYNNLTSSSSGARVLASSDTIRIAGIFTPGSNTFTNTGSTINFSSTGSQTIPAFNYYNLTSSSSGIRVLANSGTVGVAGVFIPGTNTYTITSSTVNYNGAGAQTVTAFNYQNLTVSAVRDGSDITFESGVIGIAGTATFSATGLGTWVVADNAVEYNGSGQTVANFTYNDLTLSGAGAITTSTSVIVNGVLSLEGTAAMSAAITFGTDATLQFNKASGYTVDNINWPSTFSGAGGVIIKNTGIITLNNNAKSISGGALSVETGAQLNLGTNTGHTAVLIVLGGVFQSNNGAYGGSGSGAANTNSTFFAAAAGLITMNNIKTWTGATSTSWTTSTNWNPVNAPSAASTVVIPAAPTNQPAVSGASTCLNLILNSGASLTITSNTLTIAGNFTNEGGTLSGAGTVAFNGVSKTITGASTTFPNVTINNNRSVSISGSHSFASLTFATGNNNVSLTHIADASLTVLGNVTINQPSANSRIKAWNINAGSATVGGLITIGGGDATTTTSRETRIVITSGTLNANGGITFANVNNTGRQIIMSGGAGRINLGGTLTLVGQQTLTAGTSGSTVNFAGSSAQTIPYFSSGGYNNLEINNTAGATLVAAVTTSNVAGNVLVSSGTLNNGGFAIAGNGSGSFTVSNGATFTLTGTSAFPTGFGTFVVDNNSTVNYAGGNQNIAARQYGNLTIDGTSTKTPLSGTHTINGDFLILASTYAANTNNPILNIGGNFTNSGGTYTTGTGILTFNGSTQVISGTNSFHNLNISSSVSTTLASNTTIVNAAGSAVTIAEGSRLQLSTFTLSRGTGLSTLTINGTLGIGGVTNFPTGFALPPTMGVAGTVDYNLLSGGQTIVSTFYQNLTLSHTSGTSTAAGTISVAGILTTTSGGIFNLGTNLLSTLGSAINNGTISTSNTSGAPLPSNITWGGTVRYAATAGLQTVVPGTYTNVTLSHTTDSNTLAGNMTISGLLALSGGRFYLGGNTLTLNGTLTGFSATSSFSTNGGASLVVGGSGALGSSLFFSQSNAGVTNRITDLSYNRGSDTLTLGNALQVTGTVTPISGKLASGGNLTLVSNGNGTARVAAGSGSYITGNVIVQRFIPAVARRWRFYGSPVSGSTFADLKNEMYITGINGATNGFDPTLSNQASVYSYDETMITGDADIGYVAATHINNPITVGKGYRIFIRGDRSDTGRLVGTTTTQNAVILDVRGPLNMGNIALPVTYTSSGVSANDGWNLVANPYASAIDWNAFYDAATDYSNLSPTIYIYNASNSSYTSFNAVSNAGIGSLSNGIIPSGAAFWVQSIGASPSLTMKEIYKTALTPAAVFKTTSGQFTIKVIKDSITSDEAGFKYLTEATAGYDRYDIKKLKGSTVDISSIGNDGSFLSMNCKPFNGHSDTILLSLGFANSGEYTMKFGEVDAMGIGSEFGVYLVDEFKQQITDLRNTSTYTFTVDKNDANSFGNNRFKLVVGTDAVGVDEFIPKCQLNGMYVYPSSTHDKLTVYSQKVMCSKNEVALIDQTGKTMVTITNPIWEGNKLELDLSAYASGIYFISVMQPQQPVQTLKCVKQ